MTMSARSSKSAGDCSREESHMSMAMDHPFPRLKNAQKNEEVSRDYKSGASFQGSVQDNKKSGLGTFIWPNGAKYSGEYMENDRHGKGVQEWPDGSKYEGEFFKDQRHGEGEHTWANGESYSGTFYHDRRHGKGVYRWPDGSSYTGTFYIDQKEGYGTFNFADGKVFEGLYHKDEREGPGVVHYPDGRDDVGLWRRENLTKLCSDVDGAFTMKDHPEYEYSPEDHKMYVAVDPPQNRYDVIDSVLNPPPLFDYAPEVDITQKAAEIFSEGLRDDSLALDVEKYNNSEGLEKAKSTISEKDVAGRDEDDEEEEKERSNLENSNKYPKSAPPRPGKNEMKYEMNDSGEYLAWNNTPSNMEMQRHIMMYHPMCKAVSFDVDKVLSGSRDGFGEKGDSELASEEFIKAAAEGDVNTCYDMLNSGEVYVDVADKKGHTALLAASTNWHHDVINCLLDSGANVNKLNDEGISALGACHVFFYPLDSFQFNIAETYLETPADFEREPVYDVKEALKGILNASHKRKPSPENKKASDNLENKKIQLLKEEYGGINEMPSVEQPEYDCFNNIDPTGKRLGTLNVKRAVKINVDDIMAYDKSDQDLMIDLASNVSDTEDDFSDLASHVSEFHSERSVKNFPTAVSNQMIERGATALSVNEMIVSRSRSVASHVGSLGTVRRLAIDKSLHALMEGTIQLLLKRGANPNASAVPMPVLFFAVKAADVAAVKLLLEKGASTSAKLSADRGGLFPLHIAVALPGEEGVQITELLLNSLADPDARADVDKSFLNSNLEEEWSKDAIEPGQQEILGGRTPLHIACARDDNYKNACKVVHLLLKHHANTNLLCNGHSPLALAIISGNDMAIDELLVFGVDPCLPLTHGVGSALCVASTTEYEHRRNPDGRIKLIDKLIKAGADILAPIPIGPKRLMGSAVDYAYYLYNLDRRIAHMPYHALTHAERETFNARRRLLAHMGDILRLKAVEMERRRMQEEEFGGGRSRSPSPNFVYTKAGAPLPSGIIKTRGGRAFPLQDSRVSFGRNSRQEEAEVRRPIFRYCYECGRSVFVRLAACTRCKEVYYCSKACKLKAWNARHKEECIRIAGTGRSPSPSNKDKRIDSPTPATDPDKGKPTTVNGIAALNSRIKLPELNDNSPNVFMRGDNYSYDPDNPDENFDPNDPNGFNAGPGQRHGGKHRDRRDWDGREGGRRGNRGGSAAKGGRRGNDGRGRSQGQGGKPSQHGPPGSKPWQQGSGGQKVPGPPGSKQWQRGPPGANKGQQGSAGYGLGTKKGGGYGSQVKKRASVRSKSAGRERENLAVLHTNHPRPGKVTNIGQGQNNVQGYSAIDSQGQFRRIPRPPGSENDQGSWIEVGPGHHEAPREGPWNPNLPNHLSGQDHTIDPTITGSDRHLNAWAEVPYFGRSKSAGKKDPPKYKENYSFV